MFVSRVGFLAGLIITGIFGFPHYAHQGKYTQKPLYGSVALATLRLGQSPIPLVSLTSRRQASAAVGHPVVHITHAALVRWTKVAICEEGGNWHADGSIYSGGIGWRLATWQMFKAPWMPARMAWASVTEQVWAAQRFAGYYHLVPDQHGCTGGY